MIYLDTSALIKRYVVEKGSERTGDLLRQGLAGTATIAYAEFYSGLTRRRREEDISEPHYAFASREFEEDWPAYLHVELQQEVLEMARTLIQRHSLRAFEAIHLASALGLKERLNEDITLVAADDRLLRAALLNASIS